MLVFKKTISKISLIIFLLIGCLFGKVSSLADDTNIDGLCHNPSQYDCLNDSDNTFSTTRNCVMTPKNQTYLNPRIIVNRRDCSLDSCRCDYVELEINQCNYLIFQGFPRRICARIVNPNVSINGYQNSNNYEEICAFDDPLDGADSDGPVPQIGHSPHHYNEVIDGFTWNQTVYDGQGGGTMGNPIACIPYPPGPPPPGYSKKLPIITPYLSVDRVCNAGESPKLYIDASKRCVLTDSSLNGIQASSNSFEKNIIRVGYNFKLPICTTPSSTACVNIYGLDPESLDDNKLSLITQCSGNSAPNNPVTSPCITYSDDIVAKVGSGSAVTLGSNGEVRLIYEYNYSSSTYSSSTETTNHYNTDNSVPCSGKEVWCGSNVTKTLYGVDVGNFRDLTFAFTQKFTDGDITTPSNFNSLNSYGGDNNSYVSGDSDHAGNTYKLDRLYPYNNPIFGVQSFNIFSYIDVKNPTAISAYQEGQTNNLVLGSVDRSPITDIAVGPSSLASSNVAPSMNVTLGASPNDFSSDVGVGYANFSGTYNTCNSNWDTCSSAPAKIYLHGINVNNVIPAQSTDIFSSPTFKDYITSSVNLAVDNTLKVSSVPGFVSPGPFVITPGTTAAKVTNLLRGSCANPANTPNYNTLLLTGVGLYDCTEFGSNFNTMGYLGGIEFKVTTNQPNSYLRGADTLCLDTTEFNNLIPNNSVLSWSRDGSTGNLQVDRLSPVAAAALPFSGYYSLGSSQVCYEAGDSPRNCPTCINGACCDSCLTNKCGSAASCDATTTGNSLYDYSYQINSGNSIVNPAVTATEIVRFKLPWELSSLTGGSANSNNLCINLNPIPDCTGVPSGYPHVVWSNGSSIPVGQILSGNGCASGYYTPPGSAAPQATCYPAKDSGVWGSVVDNCVVSDCNNASLMLSNASINPIANSPAVTSSGNFYSGTITCNVGYQASKSPITASCSNTQWTVDGSCSTYCENNTITLTTLIDGYFITTGTTQNGGTVTATCDAGFDTPPVATCGNGNWSYSKSNCSQMPNTCLNRNIDVSDTSSCNYTYKKTTWSLVYKKNIITYPTYESIAGTHCQSQSNGYCNLYWQNPRGGFSAPSENKGATLQDGVIFANCGSETLTNDSCISPNNTTTNEIGCTTGGFHDSDGFHPGGYGAQMSCGSDGKWSLVDKESKCGCTH